MTKLLYGQMRSAVAMVAGAATISAIDNDGVVQWTEGLHVGRHNVAQWLPFMGPDLSVEFDGEVSILLMQPRVRRLAYGRGSHDTGANPDFIVTSATRNQRELDRKLAILTAKSDKMDRQLSAMESLRERRADLVDNVGMGPNRTEKPVTQDEIGASARPGEAEKGPERTDKRQLESVPGKDSGGESAELGPDAS